MDYDENALKTVLIHGWQYAKISNIYTSKFLKYLQKCRLVIYKYFNHLELMFGDLYNSTDVCDCQARILNPGQGLV